MTFIPQCDVKVTRQGDLSSAVLFNTLTEKQIKESGQNPF